MYGRGFNQFQNEVDYENYYGGEYDEEEEEEEEEEGIDLENDNLTDKLQAGERIFQDEDITEELVEYKAIQLGIDLRTYPEAVKIIEKSLQEVVPKGFQLLRYEQNGDIYLELKSQQLYLNHPFDQIYLDEYMVLVKKLDKERELKAQQLQSKKNVSIPPINTNQSQAQQPVNRRENRLASAISQAKNYDVPEFDSQPSKNTNHATNKNTNNFNNQNNAGSANKMQRQDTGLSSITQEEIKPILASRDSSDNSSLNSKRKMPSDNEIQNNVSLKNQQVQIINQKETPPTIAAPIIKNPEPEKKKHHPLHKALALQKEIEEKASSDVLSGSNPKSHGNSIISESSLFDSHKYEGNEQTNSITRQVEDSKKMLKNTNDKHLVSFSSLNKNSLAGGNPDSILNSNYSHSENKRSQIQIPTETESFGKGHGKKIPSPKFIDEQSLYFDKKDHINGEAKNQPSNVIPSSVIPSNVYQSYVYPAPSTMFQQTGVSFTGQGESTIKEVVRELIKENNKKLKKKKRKKKKEKKEKKEEEERMEEKRREESKLYESQMKMLCSKIDEVKEKFENEKAKPAENKDLRQNEALEKLIKELNNERVEIKNQNKELVSTFEERVQSMMKQINEKKASSEPNVSFEVDVLKARLATVEVENAVLQEKIKKNLLVGILHPNPENSVNNNQGALTTVVSEMLKQNQEIMKLMITDKKMEAKEEILPQYNEKKRHWEIFFKKWNDIINQNRNALLHEQNKIDTHKRYLHKESDSIKSSNNNSRNMSNQIKSYNNQLSLVKTSEKLILQKQNILAEMVSSLAEFENKSSEDLTMAGYFIESKYELFKSIILPQLNEEHLNELSEIPEQDVHMKASQLSNEDPKRLDDSQFVKQDPFYATGSSVFHGISSIRKQAQIEKTFSTQFHPQTSIVSSPGSSISLRANLGNLKNSLSSLKYSISSSLYVK